MLQVNEFINSYYANNAEKLHKLVDKILFKLRFMNIDNDDFYSLANEVFTDVVKRYDGKQDFDGFLYSCLTNKFKTEMTRRNRIKRQIDKNAISLDAPVGDNENSTIGDLLADEDTIEKKFFEENEEVYSVEMQQYLSRLPI